jgi:hypothetical protein
MAQAEMERVMTHSTKGVHLGGRGNRKRPCLAVSQPVWLHHEIVQLDNEPPGRAQLVTYWFGERWISTWLFPRDLVDSGYLDQAFRDPVLLALEGNLDVGYLDTCMYAITYLNDEPEWIVLGPQIRWAEELRYPDNPRREVADLLLSRLQGNPAKEIARLIKTVR